METISLYWLITAEAKTGCASKLMLRPTHAAIGRKLACNQTMLNSWFDGQLLGQRPNMPIDAHSIDKRERRAGPGVRASSLSRWLMRRSNVIGQNSLTVVPVKQAIHSPREDDVLLSSG